MSGRSSVAFEIASFAFSASPQTTQPGQSTSRLRSALRIDSRSSAIIIRSTEILQEGNAPSIKILFKLKLNALTRKLEL
jgi:hypothetical protein